MARPKAFEIQDTPLTWAIRSMRRRLRLRQVKFSELVLGSNRQGLVSRWESGQLIPDIPNLLRLLALGATPEERRPIIDALKARGIDDVVAKLPAYLSSNPGNISVSPSDSIAPAMEGSNGQIA